jgi:hypothetical protein
MVDHMKTTVHIPDNLLQAAKKVAARHGTSVKELIIEGLRRVVKERTSSSQSFRLRKVTFSGEGLQAELKGASWEKVREQIYEGRGE